LAKPMSWSLFQFHQLTRHAKTVRRRLNSALCILHSSFEERTNTSCYLAIPTRGFTAAVSVFRGTPPPKPLECKFWLNTSGALLCERWA
jgi:hypothetical protein